MANIILETKQLSKQFEGLVAIDEVSISFSEGELTAMIGPNGAGKTTFFNLITGNTQPTGGRIMFKGNDITHLDPERIAQMGLVQSYQVSNFFKGLSVFENIRVATQINHNHYDIWNRAEELEELNRRAESILRRVDLSERRDTLAKNLSHGEQRTLDIAIALGTDPDFLLLDEPSSGMSPEETTAIIKLISKLSNDQLILLIEHKMDVVMQLVNRIVVLHNGSIIADDSPAKVRDSKQVQRVYLGGG